MTAKVVSTGNDVDGIKAAIKTFGDGLDDVTKAIAAAKKALAEMGKKPDECRKSYETFYTQVATVSAEAKELEKTAKDLNKSVVK